MNDSAPTPAPEEPPWSALFTIKRLANALAVEINEEEWAKFKASLGRRAVQTGTYYVVRFAVRGNEPKILFISEDEHDRWCECEPQEGYLVFKTLHTFDLDDITDECLANIVKFAANRRDTQEANGQT